MQNTNIYIGFETFEKLLATGFGKTVYLAKSVSVRALGSYGIEQRDYTVTASIVAPKTGGDSISTTACHYWQMRLGGFRQLAGKPMIDSPINSPENCLARSESLIEELSKFARDNQFAVIPGLISFPKDLLVLEGTTRTFRYDRKTNRFERETIRVDHEEKEYAA